MDQMKENLKRYVVALRPWSYSASFTPAALGAVLAYKATGEFSLPIFCITLVTTFSVHAAGNLVNTYFDYLRGVDDKSSDERILVDRLLKPEDIQWLIMMSYTIGSLGFLALSFTSTAKMEHLALIFFCGLASSFLYTGGLGLKYIALGDVVIFLTFGPVSVMFSFLSQVGQISLGTLWYAFPLALNIIGILHANNTRDMESDREAKITTVAILLGSTGSYMFFVILLFLPYLMLIGAGLYVSKWMILPVLTVKDAFNLEKDFRNGQLIGTPQRMAMLNLSLGVLYVAAIVMTENSNLPALL